MIKKLGDDGFTLIEMMIVLLIISVLILIAIPNVAKHSKTIDDKGCEAYIKMLEGQVEAYKIEEKKVPTETELSEYMKKGSTLVCPNGEELEIVDGVVQVAKGVLNENP